MDEMQVQAQPLIQPNIVPHNNLPSSLPTFEFVEKVAIGGNITHVEKIGGCLVVSSKDKEKTVRVLDVGTWNQLASFGEDSPESSNARTGYSFQYLSSSNKLLVVGRGNYVKLLGSSDTLGTFSLGAAIPIVSNISSISTTTSTSSFSASSYTTTIVTSGGTSPVISQVTPISTPPTQYSSTIPTPNGPTTSSKTETSVTIDLSLLEGIQLLKSLEQIGYDVSKDKSNDVIVHNCTTYTYQYDLDGNGIIDALGTDGVTVMCSGISKGTAEKFIEKGEVFCWTQNEPNSWFCVDFGENRSVIPSHYTLRYGSSGDACCPRNWILQGATYLPPEGEMTLEDWGPDSSYWTTIKVHEDDHSLNGSHAYCTWPINDCVNSFRYLKIIQTGPNCYDTNGESEDKWSNVLVASGYEVYGVLKEKTTVQQSIVQDVRDFVAQIKQNIDTQQSKLNDVNNKLLQWTPCRITMPYDKLKRMFLSLVAQIGECVGFTVAHAILERLKLYATHLGDKDTQGFYETTKQKTQTKSSANTSKDSTSSLSASSTLKDTLKDSKTTKESSDSTTTKFNNMNCEYNRFESFHSWPHTSTNYFAKPSALATAGFYHDPKPVQNVQSGTQQDMLGIDRCVCFSCQLALDTWEEMDDPWEAHWTHNPSCRFIQGKPTSNVPLAVTLSALPAKRHGNEGQEITCLSVHPSVNSNSRVNHSLVIGSADGSISLWDAALNLNQIHSFNVWAQLQQKPEILDSFVGAVLLAMTPSTSSATAAKATVQPTAPSSPAVVKKEKWAKWISSGIQVEQTEYGLYPGARGVVLEILSEEEVCVLVSGFNEVMNFPVKHLKPVKPKTPNQKVKVIQGDLKGSTGTYLSLQKTTAAVKIDNDKTIKSLDINYLAVISGDENESSSQHTVDVGPICILLITNNATQSFIHTFEFNKGKLKHIDSINSKSYGHIISYARIESLNKFVILCKGAESKYHLVSYQYNEQEGKLNEDKSILVDSASKLVKLVPINMASGMGNILIVLSMDGELLFYNPSNLDKLNSVKSPVLEEQDFIDVKYCDDYDSLIACTSSGSMHLFAPSKQQYLPTQAIIDQEQQNKLLGDITLENILSLNKLDYLEPLSFIAYPPAEVKQLTLNQRNGTSTRIKWHFPSPMELAQKESHFIFEIELPRIQIVDRLELSIVFSNLPPISSAPKEHSSQAKVSTTEENHIKNGKQEIAPEKEDVIQTSTSTTHSSASGTSTSKQSGYFISLSYLNNSESLKGGGSSWNTALNKCDLISLIRHESDFVRGDGSSLLSSDLSEDSSLADHYVPINVNLRTRRVLITLHYYPSTQTSSNDSSTPRINIINTLTLSLYGLKSNTPDLLTKRQKRVSLFSAKEFHVKLLKIIQEGTTRIDLRNAALELLYNILCSSTITMSDKGSSDLGYLLSQFSFLNFLIHNVVSVSTSTLTATLATKILTHIAMIHKDQKENILGEALNIVQYASDRAVSSTSCDQLFSLISHFWHCNPSQAFSRCIDILCHFGSELYGHRNPFYNILRTYFDLYGYPLENDLFAARPLKEGQTFMVGGDELTNFQYAEHSSNVTVDQKKKTAKFSKIHRSGNWVILDLGTLCLVTDIFITLKLASHTTASYSSITGQVSIDSFKKYPGTPPERLVVHKVHPSRKKRKTNKQDAFEFHQLSRLCRYVKIDIKSFTPSGEAATMNVELFGINDFIDTTNVDSSTSWGPKLKSQLRAAEEKHHTLLDEFTQKRRKLTTLLEEINISGDSFKQHESEVSNVYNECMHAQVEYHKENVKLKRLRQIEMDLGESLLDAPQFFYESTTNEADCQLDRWTYFAEQLCRLVLQDTCVEESVLGDSVAPDFMITLPKKLLEELFKHFCVFGTQTLRRQVGKLIKYQLYSPSTDQAVDGCPWPSFLSDSLVTYFSTPIVPIGPLNLFPHTEVYRLLQDIIQQSFEEEDENHMKKRVSYINDLFSLLESITTKNQPSNEASDSKSFADQMLNPQSTDLALVAWVLSLLSNNISLMSSSDSGVIHPGTKCHSCQMSPIRGVRYRCTNCPNYELCEQCESKFDVIHNKLHLFLKINKPLPPVQTGAQSPNSKRKFMESPLLPILYTGKQPKESKVASVSGDGDELVVKSTIHSGVVCDGCGSNIVGIRYKCVNCDDYDLCESCEGKVEHYPLHLFLRIRYPIPIPTPSTPTAAPLKTLIPNVSLIPMLLSKSQSHPSSSLSETPSISPNLLTLSSTSSTSPLLSIFSLLLSSWKHPLSTNVLLLAARVLEGLAKQYSANDILIHLFKHPQFGQFLQNVASYPDAFLRNGVLHTIEALCNVSTYSSASADEVAQAIGEIHKILGAHAVSLLTQNTFENSANFLLEMLEIVTTKQTDGKPRSLDESTINQFFKYLESCSLSSVSTARSWCMSFRLLELADTTILVNLHANSLLYTVKSTLLTSEDLQILLQNDFTQFIETLLNKDQQKIPGIFLGNLMTALVDTFQHAKSEDNPLLYLTLVTILKSTLANASGSPSFDVSHLASLLQYISSLLPSESSSKLNDLKNQQLSTSTDRLRKDKGILQEVTELINIILQKANESNLSLCDDLIKNEKESSKGKSFLQLLKWLAAQSPLEIMTANSNLASSTDSSITPSSLLSLRDEIVRTLEILSTSNEGGKYLCNLSLSVLYEKPNSPNVAQLIFKLVRNDEQLNYHFAVELEGCKFLFDQLNQSSNQPNRPSMLAPISNALLSNIQSMKPIGGAGSSYAGSDDSKAKKAEKSTQTSHQKSSSLENLNPFCKILENDNLLSRLLRESGNSSSCIWTHQFKKKNANETPEFAITIQLPTDVILREIQIHAMQNYHISTGSGNSLFPPYVIVQSGMSLHRLLPSGRFQCIANKNQPNPSRCYTSSFKFTLPSLEVAQIVRLKLACPDKSNWIALSRIQLRGYTLGNFNEIDISNSGHLALLISLQLLAHLIRFTKVQVHLSKEDSTQAIAVSLIHQLNSSTQPFIQDILWYLCKHNVDLSNKLLDGLLIEGQSTHHAILAGRICAIMDSRTSYRINKLKEFVFSQLSKNLQFFSSQLTPFLNALSYAITQQQRYHEQKGNLIESVNASDMEMVFKSASLAMEGSLMEESSLKLMSSLVRSNENNYQTLIKQFKQKLEESQVEAYTTDASGLRVLGFLASCSSQVANVLLNSQIPSTLLQSIESFFSTITSMKRPPASTLKRLETKLNFFASISHHHVIKEWMGQSAIQTLFKLSSGDFTSTVLHATMNAFRACANLNLSNQQKIATYLLDQANQQLNEAKKSDSSLVSSSLSMPSMLQLMVEMFSFDQKVAVCLHKSSANINSVNIEENEEIELLGEDLLSDSQVNKLNSHTKRGLRLDPEYCDPHIELDENLLTATCTTTTKWCTVLANEGYSSGVHKWDVVIDKCTSTCNIMIGVCERNQNLAYYIGQDTTANGWAYYGCNGYLYHGGGSKPYGSKFKQGDILNVELDMDSGTLSFGKNGTSFGIAYSTGLEDKELFPAVSVYDIGDTVTFVDTSKKDYLKGMTGSSSIFELRLDTSSPLRFQRVSPVFQFPINFALDQLALKLLGSSDANGASNGSETHIVKKTVQFYLLTGDTKSLKQKQSLDNKLTLEQLIQQLKQMNPAEGESEIIDLVYTVATSIIAKEPIVNTPPMSPIVGSTSPSSPSQSTSSASTSTSTPASVSVSTISIAPSTPTSSIPNQASANGGKSTDKSGVDKDKEKTSVTPIESHIPPILDLFASQSGLPTLVQLLYTYYRQCSKSNQTTDKLEQQEIHHRKKWLKVLNSHIKISGYADLFVKNIVCRTLLFRVMKSAKDQSITEPIQPSNQTISKSSNQSNWNLVDNIPVEPLYDTLFQLYNSLKTSTTHYIQVSSVINESLASGVIRLLLNRLSHLCSVDHRNPAAFEKKRAKEKEKEKEKKDEKKKSSDVQRQEFWAKGTGFGTTADDKLASTWSQNDYTKQQESKAQQITSLYSGINSFLTLDGNFPEGVFQILNESCLLPSVEGYLRNDSIMDMLRFKQLHTAVLQLVRTIAANDSLIALLAHTSSNIGKLMEQLNSIAQLILKTITSSKQKLEVEHADNKQSSENKSLPNSASDKQASGSASEAASKASSSPSPQPVSTGKGAAPLPSPSPASTTVSKKSLVTTSTQTGNDDTEELSLARDISITADLVNQRIEELKNKAKATSTSGTPLNESTITPALNSSVNALYEAYKAALKPLQFAEISMKKKGQYVHHYKSRIEKDELVGMSEKVKRLIQEVGSMSTSLPLYLESSIFARVDEARIDVMEALITGPTGTPYANGCFLFDIYCPPEYPKVPPLVNLQTTGGGSVRFNPNLYNCGKVCLSLLGTWKGAENEKWNAKTSTLLQVFVSIQSLILVEEPYFNEPGYETEIGKPSGIQHSREYNEVIRVATVKWAMVEQLKRPSPGFEDVIKNHFTIKRAEILKQCYEWVKEASTSKTPGHYDKIKKVFEELQKELQKLDPSPLEAVDQVGELEKKEKAEKEAKRKELTQQLQEILTGFPTELYMKALELSDDKIDVACNWLLENADKNAK